MRRNENVQDMRRWRREITRWQEHRQERPTECFTNTPCSAVEHSKYLDSDACPTCERVDAKGLEGSIDHEDSHTLMVQADG